LPTCYAPVRRAPVVLLQPRTRLACVKHAASVRSEPGSNSRLKLVAWRKKMLRFASEPAYQANYCRSNLLRPFALENSNGFEQILAHRIGCQRAKPPCPAERHSYSPRSISEGTKIVNPRITISTAILTGTAIHLRRGTMRQKSLGLVTCGWRKRQELGCC
jgi:hypothetical protein